MVIFHPIKFKSFPTPIAASSSWTIDCRRGPTFPRTPVTFGHTGVTGLNLYSILVAVVGAVVVLFLYHAVFRSSVRPITRP
jgi:hypothetical protein